VTTVLPAYQFEFSGGALCLDFANTLGDRPHGQEEHLVEWADFVAWAVQAGVVPAAEGRRLAEAGRGRTPAARRAFSLALESRERIYRIFSAVGAGRLPSRADVDAFNAALAETMSHVRLDVRQAGYAWGWKDDDSFDRLLRPVIRSAAELLVSPDRDAVRECASDRCSWLFLDRSPARRRRWCSMKTCGNRDKVRRFYARRKARNRAEP